MRTVTGKYLSSTAACHFRGSSLGVHIVPRLALQVLSRPFTGHRPASGSTRSSSGERRHLSLCIGRASLILADVIIFSFTRRAVAAAVSLHRHSGQRRPVKWLARLRGSVAGEQVRATVAAVR